MSNRQMPLYVTHNDLVLVTSKVNLSGPFQFVQVGLFDKPEIIILFDANELLPFKSYSVFDKEHVIVMGQVPQRDGCMKYEVDQIKSGNTMLLRYKGMFEGKRLIAGDVSVYNGDKRAEEIYALFVKEIRRSFEKIRSYYVGPEAVKLLDQGFRLTPTEKSPETYDLRRE